MRRRKMVRTVIENEIAINTSELIEIREENERSRSCGKFLNSLSVIILHVLDTLLLVVLLPFMLWQWISANDHLRIVLRAIIEVTLELIMWVIFAGVSVLMTATFVVQDIYVQKNDEDKLRRLLIESIANDETNNNSKETRVLDTESFPKGKDKLKHNVHSNNGDL